jgi:hypothetical protein
VHTSKLTTFLFCALLLFPLTAWADGETTKTQDEKHIYTVIEFESTFMNKKQEKVLNTLGEPDERSEINGNEVWTYHKIIKDQEKLWNQNIMFDFGRVNQMWGTLLRGGAMSHSFR